MDSDVWRPRCGVEMTNKMDAELSRLLLSCSSRKAEWRISFRGRPDAKSSSSGSVWLWMLLASTSPSIPAHRSRHAPINQRLREGALPEPITSSTALGAPCLGVRLRMRGRTSQNVSMRCSPPASCTSGSIFRAAAPNLTRFWRRCAVISSAKMASVATGHTISLPFHIKTPPHTVLLRGYKAQTKGRRTSFAAP